MRSLTSLASLAVVLVAFAAHADRAELHIVPALAPELMSLTVPTAGGSSSASKPTVAFSVSGFYGITNTLHAGVELRYTGLKNVPFEHTSVALSDGSSPTGTLYSDTTLYSATAFALYRVDLPSAIVPVFRLGGGPVIGSYRNLALYPDQTQFQLSQPDQSEVGFAVTVSAGAQYRIGNHWLAALLVEVRRNLGLHVPWEYAVPLSVGYVW